MITLDDSVKALFKSDSVHKSYTIAIYNTAEFLLPADDLYPSNTLFPLGGGEPDIIIENDRIVSESVSIKGSICDSGDIIFGKCNSTILTFQCADVTGLYNGKELLVTMAIEGYATPIPVGSFIIDSIKKSADRRFRTITAYDRMSLFDVNVASWYENLWVSKSSYTVLEFRTSLCGYIGVPATSTSLVNDALTITHTITPSEISGREILEAICEINGVFGFVDANGYLKFVSLNSGTAVETIDIPLRKSLDHEDYTVSSITALTIRQEDNDIGASVGSGTNAYIIQGNFLAYGKTAAQLTTIAQTILDHISGVEYVPVQLESKGLPYLELGDCIDITLADATAIRTIVLNRTLSGVQNLTDSIISTGNKIREETFGVNKSIIQLQGKSNILERTVEGTTERVSDLETGYSELKQTVDGFTLTTSTSVSGGQTVSTLKLSSTGFETSSTVTGTTATQAATIAASAVSGITLSFTDGTASSTFVLKAGTTTLSSGEVKITGVVTFANLSTAGQTTINGGNITTGEIKSANYVSGVSGMNISLAYGTIATPHFILDSAGQITCSNATVAGTISAYYGVIGQSGSPWNIGNTSYNSFIYSSKTSFNDDSTTGLYMGTDGIAIGGSLNGNVKITRLGIASMPQLTVYYNLYIGGSDNYFYIRGDGSVGLTAYNGFYVNGTRVGS